TSDIQTKNPQLNVDINRDKASAVGVTAQQIEDALNDAYGTRQISTIYATSNEYEVIMEVKPEYQQDPSALGRLYIHSTATASTASQSSASQSALAQPSLPQTYSLQPPSGQAPASQISDRLIPLSTVAKLSKTVGPLLVN